MSKTEQDDGDDASLPVPSGAARPRPSLAHSAPTAAFVSQLIAARQKLGPYPVLRPGTPAGALSAYGKGARISERRMPLGYRKTMLV
ncbi:hypothetical protein [Devosia faecipullorum]|uniref:hypothetical protein n=1 Tax=Devosia faecipullorum TaxID=2755039 RepID=UPI00187B836D|nr:hypothetical protein [Devosia faecipullorum]MBE7732765.1 hypothetical protein [Devosia faecipullorum]